MKKKINKKKGILFWITGLSGSGKTTISKKIKKNISNLYGPTILVSGDDLRKIFGFNKFNQSIEKKLVKNPNLLIAGDFNIIPEEIDVHDFDRYKNDALGRLEIRKKYRELINLGFQDIYRIKNKTKPSDHTPIELEIS